MKRTFPLCGSGPKALLWSKLWRTLWWWDRKLRGLTRSTPPNPPTSASYTMEGTYPLPWSTTIMATVSVGRWCWGRWTTNTTCLSSSTGWVRRPTPTSSWPAWGSTKCWSMEKERSSKDPDPDDPGVVWTPRGNYAFINIKYMVPTYESCMRNWPKRAFTKPSLVPSTSSFNSFLWLSSPCCYLSPHMRAHTHTHTLGSHSILLYPTVWPPLKSDWRAI